MIWTFANSSITAKNALVIHTVGFTVTKGYWYEKYDEDIHRIATFGRQNKKLGMLFTVQYLKKPTFQCFAWMYEYSEEYDIGKLNTWFLHHSPRSGHKVTKGR